MPPNPTNLHPAYAAAGPAAATTARLAAPASRAYKTIVSAPELPRDDLAAAVAARRELGDEAEPALVESFLDRVEAAIDARVDERLARDERPRRSPSGSRASVPLALGSMGIGIAATGAANGLAHGGALVAIVAWLVIAAINIAHALGR